MISKEDIERFIERWGPDPEEQAHELPPKTGAFSWLEEWWNVFKQMGSRK